MVGRKQFKVRPPCRNHPSPPWLTLPCSLFTQQLVFRMELAEYAKEGIDGAKITYDDNQPLLDLMLQKRGLISLLDEEVTLFWDPCLQQHIAHGFCFSALTVHDFFVTHRRAIFHAARMTRLCSRCTTPSQSTETTSGPWATRLSFPFAITPAW